MKISMLTNIPGPYRAALLDAWSETITSELAVYYTDEGDQGRGWSTPVPKTVSEHRLKSLFRFPGWGRMNSGLFSMVKDSDVVIIGGFEQASYLVAAVIARILAKKVIICFDGINPQRFGRENAAILLVKRAIISLCHCALANGTVGRRYISEILGFSALPVFNQYLSGNVRYIEDAFPNRTTKKSNNRLKFGLPDEAVVVMCCCYVEPRKRLDIVIEALSSLGDRRIVLMVVGSGSIVEQISLLAARRGVECVFPGFLEGADLAAAYLSADLFILASDNDPWGLVVHEALVAGLPVVVSDACGCHFDFVDSGVNGYVFEHGNVASAKVIITQSFNLEASVASDRSRQIGTSWNLQKASCEFKRCIGSVSRVSQPSQLVDAGQAN